MRVYYLINRHCSDEFLGKVAILFCAQPHYIMSLALPKTANSVLAIWCSVPARASRLTFYIFLLNNENLVCTIKYFSDLVLPSNILRDPKGSPNPGLGPINKILKQIPQNF